MLLKTVKNKISMIVDSFQNILETRWQSHGIVDRHDNQGFFFVADKFTQPDVLKKQRK